jgi:serine/threonine-protein kinase
MTEAALLTSSTAADREAPPVVDTFPEPLLAQSVRRVGLLAWVTLAVGFVAWVGVGVIDGFLWGDLQSFPQWGPPTLGMLASLLMALSARRRWPTPRAVVRVALVYEVLIAFSIAFSEYWGAFEAFTAELMHSDTVGFTSVAVWMFAFTAIVPTRPRSAAAALLASAAATPITYGFVVRAGGAPALGPGQFFWVLVFPYLIVAALAYLTARIIYGLGRDVQRARELGCYRLEHRLGEGGMGEVWRATHCMLARPAAVKLVSPALLAAGPEKLAETLARFEREAQATAELQSTHTVSVYDYGVADDGRIYYVMELLDGVDLEDLVREHGPLPPERVIHVLLQACDSLGEAHGRGLIHRDIKPGNLFLCRYALKYDVLKVLDFGLAKHRHLDSEKGVQLTRADVIRGTPAYMAPELATGDRPVDGRADLYALGCVAYWLLSGTVVFGATSPIGMIAAHVGTAPTPLTDRSELGIPAALDALVMDCLAKDPAARPDTAEDLAERLASIEVADGWTPARAAEWWELHRPGAEPV